MVGMKMQYSHVILTYIYLYPKHLDYISKSLRGDVCWKAFRSDSGYS